MCLKSASWRDQSSRQIRAILFGTALVSGGLVYFQILSNLIPVGARDSNLLAESGYGVAALLLTGLTFTLWGLTRLLQGIGSESSRISSSTIRIIFFCEIEIKKLADWFE